MSALKSVIWICGMPRSGTSWLGQIFDSHPEVIYRLSPLFSYAYKDAISEKSTTSEIRTVFQGIAKSDDEFMTQADRRKNGEYPVFEQKSENATTLVIKDTRYHHLIPSLLQRIPELKLIYLVRNPCAAINSWIRAPREFASKGCTLEADWKSGACRKSGPEEFWGFNDWLTLTERYRELAVKYPGRIMLVQYEDLVQNAIKGMENLFEFCGLTFDNQSRDFIERSQRENVEGEYAVFRKKGTHDHWKEELDPEIHREIKAELESRGLMNYYQ